MKKKLVVIAVVVAVFGVLAFIGCMSLEKTPELLQPQQAPVQQIHKPAVAPKVPLTDKDRAAETVVTKRVPKSGHVEFTGVGVSFPSQRKEGEAGQK